MARPKKQTVEYFPHYTTSGKTLYILESEFGNDGYAFWFKLLELLGSSDGHVYDCNNAPSWKFLLAKTRVDEETAMKILDTLSDLEAIDKKLWEHKLVWSDNFVQNLAPVYSNRRTSLPKKPIVTYNNDSTNELLHVETQDVEVSTKKTPQSKVKESRVEESKVEESNSNNTAAEIKKKNPVALVDADSTKQDVKPVIGVDADSTQQEDIEKREKDLQQIENYYKQHVRRKNMLSSRDLSDIVFAYETYGQDADFIISVLKKAKQDYLNRYGKLEINSFSYFLSIFEEKWNLLHGEAGKSKPRPKKTRFHNFEQRSDKYTAKQLEEMAERKKEEFLQKKRETKLEDSVSMEKGVETNGMDNNG